MPTKYTNRKRRRGEISSSSDEYESSDTDSNSYQNYRTPVVKKRKINYSEYEKLFRKTLKSTSVLLQNTKQEKFIEVVLNNNINRRSNSYSFIKGNFGQKGRTQTRYFKYKKTAIDEAIKLLIV